MNVGKEIVGGGRMKKLERRGKIYWGLEKTAYSIHNYEMSKNKCNQLKHKSKGIIISKIDIIFNSLICHLFVSFKNVY